VLVTAIVGAEVTFWILLTGGLVSRYVLHRPRLGAALLLGSPVADLVLIVLAGADLSRGAAATPAHALAAVYVGCTVGFGARTVAWADERFARRFTGLRPPERRGDRVAEEWHLFRCAALAWAVAGALLLSLTAIAGRFDAVLLGYLALLTIAVAIWFVAGPLATELAARRPARNEGGIMDKQTYERRWAPWWIYLIVLLGANYLRQLVMPFGTIPEWAVVLVVLAGSVVLFGVVTVTYRAVRDTRR
jgi:hypothetical protein